jgi:hypothetical protein
MRLKTVDRSPMRHVQADKRRSIFPSVAQVKRVQLRAASHNLNASVFQYRMQYCPHRLVVRFSTLKVLVCFPPFLTSVCLGLVDYSEAPPVMHVPDCTATDGSSY